jgi:DNA repair exonuclease SbcCD ATPase subunit
MENELITFDDIDTSPIQVNNLSEIIGGQVDIVKKLGEKVTEAMEKASGAKDSAQKAWLKDTGWFQKKEAIESLQTAVKGIGEATEANAESQKIMYDYMQKIAQITKNLITIGCSSIAMNRATVRELELKLTGASKEKLSELAKKELLKVVTQLKQQEDIMSKQELLTTEVHTQSKKLNNVEVKLMQKDDLDDQQSKQIKNLTDHVQQHQKHLKTKDEIDEEQSQRLKEIDTLLSKINKNIQDITTRHNEISFAFQENNDKWSNEIMAVQENMSDTVDKIVLVREALDSQTKNIASISLDLKNDQQNIAQLTKQFEDYRNIMQSKIKILMLTTGITIVSIVGCITFYFIH